MIRTMRAEDYACVYALWMNCSGMGLNDLDDSEEGFARFIKRNPETCFAVEEKGTIIGVIMAGHDGRRGYIYHMAVHPDYRRRGIGTRLTEEAESALKRAGIHKVALVAFARNETGNALWEKHGFTKRDDLIYRNKTLTSMRRIDT